MTTVAIYVTTMKKNNYSIGFIITIFSSHIIQAKRKFPLQFKMNEKKILSFYTIIKTDWLCNITTAGDFVIGILFRSEI